MSSAFLLVAAVSGLAYTFTPLLAAFVLGDRLGSSGLGRAVAGGADRRPALSAYPRGRAASVIPPSRPEAAARVVLAVPGCPPPGAVFVAPVHRGRGTG
ncbi:Membrane protein OS=Streptomyces microflavus OX=1919 GN=Smic_10480 PE=4 SV=1 [Streptomyces microflavus]